MKIKPILFFLFFVFLASFVTSGETEIEKVNFNDTDTPAMVKASYIYNFAKMIDWPSSDKKGNFIIGAIGDASMYQELVNKCNGKSIGSQPIEIRKISNTLNFTTCHVLYVDQDFSDLIGEINKKIQNTSTLLVTYQKGALFKGAAINLVNVDSIIRFEMNVSNAEDHNLFVGSSLKGLALRVEN